MINMIILLIGPRLSYWEIGIKKTSRNKSRDQIGSYQQGIGKTRGFNIIMQRQYFDYTFRKYRRHICLKRS
ncbi:MAG: hypothetical protein N5P05_003197 [Chroococcopsis gigantea SAG 12.99]|nr:hypothetical protein [Chroococcopsis gigantea SAG 12.99]